jgi:hypothetical protein
MNQYVPSEQLWTEFGGKLEFEYDHATYWPALQKLCEEKRGSRRQRWVAGGSRIGEHEDYLAGGKETGVAGSTTSTGEEAKETVAPASVTEAVPASIGAAAPAATETEGVTEALAQTKLEDKTTEKVEAAPAKTESA